jgi:hypothetical protein
MKLLRIALLATVFATPPCVAFSQETGQYKYHGSISDEDLRIIDAAKPEFLKLNAVPGPYTVSIGETEHFFAVTFCLDKQKRTLSFKADGKSVADIPQCPGSFTVDLDKTNLGVRDTHYSRD